MSWTIPKRSINNKRVTLNYQDLTLNRAQASIFKQLATPVFIETEGSQVKAFHDFLGKYLLGCSVWGSGGSVGGGGVLCVVVGGDQVF